MTKYPKIETLYNRDKKTFKVTGEIRCPEFLLINQWILTEKIDGTNVRVMLEPDGRVHFEGRTDRAQMPPFLLTKLQEMFPEELVQNAFEQDDIGLWPSVVCYGEGYGERIQKGGGNYRKGVSFRLFDVRVGDWWLNWESVEDVAKKLNIKTVPFLTSIVDWLPHSIGELNSLFFSEQRGQNEPGSIVALEECGKTDVQAEGIVAHTDPLLFDRRGRRVMWKLKYKDF